MEMYQGKIGLTWDELTEGDDPIVKPNTLKSRLRRGTTRYLRRGRGRGIAALVDYESLPGAERKEWVRRHGDPYAATRDPRTIPADLVLEEDAAARRYYTYEYTYVVDLISLGNKKHFFTPLCEALAGQDLRV